MDITVYLPDELGREAKAAELNLSRLLRDAVTDELHRRKTVQSTLENPQTFKLHLENENGDQYTGRVTGQRIAHDSIRFSVYLTDDERVILYDSDELKHWQIDDPESELRDCLDDGEYATALTALGIMPIIDL